ncbi:hypothetical protein [Haladaptatus salinisoli]|uniref:hypothetical protein n=1 Tax=Haladaptatus salinisoli TaxID=2884876 RepID=UPI001D0A9232|nr:hypothetical protein [Haladaptatus salinisoli]
MSVNLNERRNAGILLALIVATVVVTAAGIAWLRGQQEPLIVEVAYAASILIVALVAYDKLLVR